MSKTLTLALLIVAGALVAPAAQADHPDLGNDACGHCGYYCHVLGDWFGGILETFGFDGDHCRDSDRRGDDAATSDLRRNDRGNDSAPASGGDRADRDTRSDGEIDTRCLACSGLPTSDVGG